MTLRLSVLLLAFLATSAHALYDPAPKSPLPDAEGRWSGTLTYRDYSDDRREVTLPVVTNVALVAPDELVFHNVYDDGPKKTVHSYERLKFDFDAKTLVWAHGLAAKEDRRYRIDSSSSQSGFIEIVVTEIADAKAEAPQCARYTLRWSRTELNIVKQEGRTCDALAVRSRSTFRRAS
ncbi:MAG: hypothetical protein J0I77_19185 [Rudaea sp.]|uniref:hypothetical protein n=1 Tax=unclassified Rudaea TaxID=2627037 RepID=UPI0010F8A33A|nr:MULTISPECIES: hypothetical protein [unclassified Rudaea]MBN8887857.1 hypothetical protein [Rudaea sp.]MBR0346218.1 hypothetical protein [Rudaea sp.]